MIPSVFNFDLKERKGGAAAYIVGLIILFVTTMLWILFSRVFTDFFPAMGKHIVGSEMQQTFDIMVTAWNNWPLMILVGIGIYWIVNSQKEEPLATQY